MYILSKYATLNQSLFLTCNTSHQFPLATASVPNSATLFKTKWTRATGPTSTQPLPATWSSILRLGSVSIQLHLHKASIILISKEIVRVSITNNAESFYRVLITNTVHEWSVHCKELCVWWPPRDRQFFQTSHPVTLCQIRELFVCQNRMLQHMSTLKAISE